MKKLIILFILAYTSSSYANPSPLGITPGKSTLSDVKEKYSVAKPVNDVLNGYYSRYLSTKNIDIDTLSEAIVVFNDK